MPGHNLGRYVLVEKLACYELLSLVAAARASVANTCAAAYIPISAKCIAFFSYSELVVIVLILKLHFKVVINSVIHTDSS
jgi:hypothetical protein